MEANKTRKVDGIGAHPNGADVMKRIAVPQVGEVPSFNSHAGRDSPIHVLWRLSALLAHQRRCFTETMVQRHAEYGGHHRASGGFFPFPSPRQLYGSTSSFRMTQFATVTSIRSCREMPHYLHRRRSRSSTGGVASHRNPNPYAMRLLE